MRHLALAASLVVASVQAPRAADAVRITPIIHASVQIEYGDFVIQVDPWSAGDLSQARPADLILITDDPAHHLDPAAIARLRKPGAPVLVPPATQTRYPDGIAVGNGQSHTVAGIRVDAIAAYDLTPGEPAHPKGEANGYLLTLGATRVYLAGVTECIPEARALRNIDILFVPMNIPPNRMAPAAAAACVKAINPARVYVYHYDQMFASSGKPGANIGATVEAFRAALRGTTIAFVESQWYPSEAK